MLESNKIGWLKKDDNTTYYNKCFNENNIEKKAIVKGLISFIMITKKQIGFKKL